MLSIFKPAAHKKRVCQQRRLTRYIADYAGRFLLASFLVMPPTIWFVRTLPQAMPYLIEQGFSRGDLGFALSGISIAYGFSKFISGIGL